jgi:hypothetical protein
VSLLRSAVMVTLPTAALLALLAAACARSAPEGTSAAGACSCGAVVVDEALLAYLSRARSAHHLADLAENESQPSRAVELLDRFAESPSPSAPEALEVRADARARLADLRSAAGDFERAERDLALGLEAARDTTYFRGRLFEVRGLVEERRAKAHDAKGDAPSARKAREAAVQAFEEAVRIQELVQKAALGQAPR